MTFSEGEELKCNGKPISAFDGGPCVTDWDGDGILDLILGDDLGNVIFYKGTAKDSLDLTMDENAYILPKENSKDAWKMRKLDSKSKYGFSPAKPGARVKPFTADWNGDGKLDLLVGDFFNLERPAPKLTEKQKKELSALEDKQRAIVKKQQVCYERIGKQALRVIGKNKIEELSQEEMQKYVDTFRKIGEQDKEYLQLNQEYYKLHQAIEKLRPTPELTGVVWVYLRK